MSIIPEQIPPHHYITTENIHAGDIILEEEPWIWSFMCLDSKFEDTGPEAPVCCYCFRAGKMLNCSACKSAWYCNTECQRADWRVRHKYADCSNLKALKKLSDKIPGGLMSNIPQSGFKNVVRRLLLSAGAARLNVEKERNSNSPLWEAVFKHESSKTDDWVNVQADNTENHPLEKMTMNLIKFEDRPDKLMQRRILPSLVLMRDYIPWKNALIKMKIPADFDAMPEQLAIGACLEMARFPNDCNPNAVVVTEGRLVRMVALEDIPNLDAVRLSRLPGWMYEPRFQRRTLIMRAVYGYDCQCNRCCDGDSGEATLFGLRCPKYAERFENNPKKVQDACDGVVKGLQRKDIDIGNRSASDIDDELRPLPSHVANAPAHVRAECQKCGEKYNESTMKKILQCLRVLNDLGKPLTNFADEKSSTVRQRALKNLAIAEQYVYPTNYAYFLAKQTMMIRTIVAIMQSGGAPLDSTTLAWAKRNVRESLQRVETDRGFKQIDLMSLFDLGNSHVYYMRAVGELTPAEGERFRDHRRRRPPQQQYAGVDAEMNGLLQQMTQAVMVKLKMVLLPATAESARL